MAGGGGSSTTTTRQDLAPEQKQLLSGVIPIAKDYLNKPLELFPGSAIAGPTDLQTAGRAGVLDAATGTVADLTQGATAGIGTGQALGGAATGAGLGQLLSGGAKSGMGIDNLMQGFQGAQGAQDFITSGALLDPNTNPALKGMTDAAVRPLTDNLMQRVLPGIRSQAVGGGMLGSSRQGIAEGQAIDDYLRQAGDVSTAIQNNSFNQGLGAMLQGTAQGTQMGIAGAGLAGDMSKGAATAGSDLWMKSLGMSPEIAKLAFLPGMTMEAVGAMGQQENQARLTEQANRFTQEQMLPFLQAQDVAQLAFGIGGGSSTSTATGQNPSNPVGTALGFLSLLPFLG